MIVSIYRITCTRTAKHYIGQSNDVLRRFKEHRRKLRAGNHHNTRLQNAWDKYDEADFEFAVELECEVDKLEYWEQRVADAFRKAEEELYNLSVDFSKPARGVKRPDNAKRLRRLHADPSSGIRRGLERYADSIRGTELARIRATHASHSRKKKERKPTLKRGHT